MTTSFLLDSKLTQNAQLLTEFDLCSLLLKNESNYPWLVLVPRRNEITEIYQLATTEQHQLMDEIDQASKLIAQYFKPDKINVAAIGNQVPQLHIHVVGRFKSDPLWPESIWQKNYSAQTYTEQEFAAIAKDLQKLLTENE